MTVADPVRISAGEIEIGDEILVDGIYHKVTGWFRDGNGRLRIEYNNRWNLYSGLVTVYRRQR